MVILIGMKPNKNPIWIPVVTAIMKKDRHVLLGCRPQGKTLPGLWEFPGGKLELNESPDEALKRELNEELGIDAEIGPLLFSSSHSFGDKAILLLFFEVSFWKGEPKNLHHSELQWVIPKDLKNIQIPETNKEILPKLLELL